MAFESLRTRINKLPLVVCGPILRALSARSVSVWVALKEKQNIALAVFDQKENGDLNEVMRGNTETIKVGENLHIAVVTANIDSDLKTGQLYYYNLFFSEDAVPTNRSKNLKKQSVIDFRIDYDYKEDSSQSTSTKAKPAALKLPSFSLPPDDLSSLRIVHGSCRKPNAEGFDAMPTIDRMIGSDWTKANDRPHLLFLAGDQIYADDVSPILLYMLMDASEVLMGAGRKEKLPKVEVKKIIEISKKSKDEEGNNLFDIKNKTSIWEGTLPLPERRGQIIKEFAKFSESFSNHLMTFGEYCAMYMFVWSDAFWGELPAFEEVFKGEEKTVDLAPQLMQLQLGVMNSTQKTTITTEEFEKYKTDKSRLINFKSKLKKIRRLLANVPSYMIFDDHEVTDDWHMTLNWGKKAFSSPLGRRIIQNGMSAYTLFQGWGNTPEQFDAQKANLPGVKLLQKIHTWTTGKGYFYEDESELRRCLALPILKTETSNAFGSSGEFVMFIDGAKKDRIKWHYRVVGKGFEVIVLDGRTKRGYPNISDALVKKNLKLVHAALIHEDVIIDQIPNFKANETIPKLTFIVSPTSILEIPALDFEEFPLIARMIAECKTKNDETVDLFDSWENQSRGFEKLLYHISARGKKLDSVVKSTNIILTGDVHFAAASKMNFKHNRLSKDQISGELPSEAVFVQLVSSSFKKQTWETKLLHYEGYKFSTIASLYHLTGSVEDSPSSGLKFFGNVAFFVLNEAYTILDQIDPFDFFEPKLPKPKKFFGWEGAVDFKDAQQLKLRVPDTSASTIALLKDGVLVPKDPKFKLIPVNPFMMLSKTEAGSILDKKLPSPRWRYCIEYFLAEDEARPGAIVAPLGVANPGAQTKDKALQAYLNAAKNHLDYAQKWGNGKEVVGVNNVSEIVFDLKENDQSLTQKTWWHLKQKKEGKEPELFPLTKYKVSLEFEKAKLPQLPD